MPIVPVDSLLDDNKHVSLNIHLLVYLSWNRCFAFPATRVSRHSRIQDSEVFPYQLDGFNNTCTLYLDHLH